MRRHPRVPRPLPQAIRSIAITIALGVAGCGPARNADPIASFDPDSIPQAYLGSTAALMWPGATRAFQIRPDGDLYNGDWMVRFDLAADGQRAGVPRVIAYEDRWCPVAHWRRQDGPVRWDFEALALPAPGADGRGLVVSLEVRATNTTPAPVHAEIAARLAPPDSFAPFVDADAPATLDRALKWGPSSPGDTVHAMLAASGSHRPGALSWTVPAGASRTARFILPSHPTPGQDLAAWARVPHARRAAEVRRYWASALEHGTHFELGDPEVEHALAAARVMLLGCRERRGTGWVPIGSPTHYRDVWLRDGARAAAALAVSGHSREARELAAGLLLFQWPAGGFMSQRGQLDGTGQALWAFEQTLLRPAPGDSVGRFAEASLRAVGWCESQRGFGRQSGWPFGMMLPFGDPRDNELVRAQLVGNDAWALAGYRASERLLRAAGRPSDADTVAGARRRYLADFALALARSGAPDVPPSWQRVGRDWGNLSAAWPCAALAASDPRCDALARRVWAAAGGAGLLTHGSRDSLHYYLGADLGTWALLAGRRAEADSVLAAMLHWRGADGGAGELFDRAGGYGKSLPQHATSAAALVALVRNALLFDDGDTLLVTLGARERWWRGARVRGAPTRWGLVDLAFQRRGNGAAWDWSPVPVWTALTLPPGTRVAGTPPPPLVPGPSPRVVLAPPGTASARVALAPEEGP